MILRRLLYFVLFSSLFISVCAVAFSMETNILLSLPFNSFWFYSFVFGATLVQYNLHYVTKTIAMDGSPRLDWTNHRKKTHFILIAIGSVLILYSLFYFSLEHYIILAILGVISFAYSFPFIPSSTGPKRLKDYGVLKILTLSLMWTIVTVWFPVNRMDYDPGLFALIFVRRLVFMFILCLLFDIRDAGVDGKQKIRTIAVTLGTKKSFALCYELLGLFVILIMVDHFYINGVYTIPLLISAAVTGGIIAFAKKHNTDITCLLGVDGMMLLQFLLVYVFSLKQ